MNTLLVCINRRTNPDLPSCGTRGGLELAELAESECTRLGLDIHVERFHCLGLCELGPNLKIAPEGDFIHTATQQDLLSVLAGLAASSA